MNRLLFRALVAAAGLGGAAAAGQSGAPRDYSRDCSSAGCHAGYGARASVHAPVADGTCDACHEKTTGDDPGAHRFKLTSPATELCTECHDDLTEDSRYVHGPVAAGGCVACHDPHAADEPALLLGPTPDLCMNCHDMIKKRIQAGPYVHPPAQEDCTACHEPHGSASNMMLSERPPQLCLECHDDVADLLDEATVQHDPVTSGRSCVACHDPHASAIEHVLKSAPMDLCLSCHDRKLPSGQDTLRDVARWLADNPDHHGPIRDGDCTTCHQPHGGENFRLLVEPYPARFYAPFAEGRYGLCFDCHESDLVLDEQTEDSTGFRNGKRNLHYLHVNRPVKGRTCRACHDVHASRQPKHIAASVPFGQWNIPINYRKTRTGGSCAPGCHKPYRYDRESPVTNLPQ